ncbi:MAG: helix-turn-helix transcriptional regulator [Burkholderiaceae bacterium]
MVDGSQARTTAVPVDDFLDGVGEGQVPRWTGRSLEDGRCPEFHAAGLGIRQFTRAFRDATGRSPHQYLLHRRVEQAKALIREGLPLADVAIQCGFSDQSQLTRTFVAQLGTTPGRFRTGLIC